MQAKRDKWPVRHLFDVRLDAITMDELLDAADDAVKSRQRLLVGVVNAAKMVNMKRDPLLRRAVLGADVIVADGMSVHWACKALLRPIPERVPGIDLMERLLVRASDRKYRVFLLGAKQEVLDAVVARIGREFPGVQVVGARNGYFKDTDDASVAAEIAASGADVLFVGITSPKKETFLANWASAMKVPVCHGVGGAFDVMAGKVKRAPQAWQKLGLEWFYRMMQEPGRLWRRYLVTNTLFLGMVLREGGRSILRTMSPNSVRDAEWADAVEA